MGLGLYKIQPESYFNCSFFHYAALAILLETICQSSLQGIFVSDFSSLEDWDLK